MIVIEFLFSTHGCYFFQSMSCDQFCMYICAHRIYIYICCYVCKQQSKFIYSEKATKLTFDCMYCSQKLGEDFAKLCGLLRIYELYQKLCSIRSAFEYASLLNKLRDIMYEVKFKVLPQCSMPSA